MHTHKSEEEILYGPWSITPQQRENVGSLYGRCDENKLIGDTRFNYDKYNPVMKFGLGQSTEWKSNGFSRLLIPQIRFNDKENIMHKSGIYSLTITYNNSNNDTSCSAKRGSKQEAGIIIGEISFDSSGYTQLPYAHGARGQQIWLSRKISEPWNDGVELKFRIDTNANTIVFQKGNTPEKVFWNILSFTKSRTYPEFLKVFAYCFGNRIDSIADSKARLTILGDINSNSNDHDE
ncbi:hypothetical protein FRACYDRAFT_250301 [Fragilariopsis cylindrus CCMP1102]|uniref:Uncharacterized protein n=1 Tax=Fragilariopsis cylindrus CCMP1102 TaxID=635003 RepID=A0A1E7EQ20_9STRA|nr:hypothetical protein FRACYDRAFT_250301 [Fragilariopsis cylindrus CCMP1102]|eukprot:OEU08080.1 hypothetical protein FRACYDRAFT_250301 [Fragilariopsis cylindrus CCMP1102]